jgi:NDP-sugar pyrophosphorylase family protein
MRRFKSANREQPFLFPPTIDDFLGDEHPARYIVQINDLKTQIDKLLGTDLHMVTDFSTEVLSQLVGRIYSYKTSEVFLDVGTPETYEQANN